MKINEEVLIKKLVEIPGIERLNKIDIENIIEKLEKQMQNKKNDTSIIK